MLYFPFHSMMSCVPFYINDGTHFIKKILLWKYIISNHFIVIHVGKEIKFVMLQVNICIFFHKSQIHTSIYSPPSSPVWPSIFFLSFRSGRKCKRLIGCVHSWLCWGWYQMFSFVTRKGYVWNEKKSLASAIMQRICTSWESTTSTIVLVFYNVPTTTSIQISQSEEHSNGFL